MKEATTIMKSKNKEGSRRVLFVVGTDCQDSSREDEFNKWYNEVHIPDIKALAGKRIPRAWRYKNITPSAAQPQYIAMYELDTDNIDYLLDEMDKGLEEWRKQGRLLDYVKLHFASVYEFIGDF
jgi:hypothetical protein